MAPSNAVNHVQNSRKVYLYGCGVVAPGASNLSDFLANVRRHTPTLETSSALNGAFMVGNPQFDFEQYRPWISERHNPARFSQLNEKAGFNVKCAVGMAIQALNGNEGLEKGLKELDPRVMICIGSGFGDVQASFQAHDELEKARKSWDKFWATSKRNEVIEKFLEKKIPDNNAPQNPLDFEIDSEERALAWDKWNSYWAPQSPQLKEFMLEFSAIERQNVGNDVASDKLNLIRAKAKAKKALVEKYGCPTLPWDAVSANFLWNIPNVPASQVSMLLGIHGVSYASIGACATFGLVMRQALDAIQSGSVDAAIIGTVDLPPPGEITAGFYAAKVLAAGNEVAIPLCDLRGTHVSGGGCLWILGAEDALSAVGVKHKGVRVLSVGLSSDAEHIITPSSEGPKHSIREAYSRAGITPKDIHTWDMHATGTPGDSSEFKLIEDFVPKNAVITARKGIFGHGMSSCGGWEVTAQVFGVTLNKGSYVIPASGIAKSAVHTSIASLGRRVALDSDETVEAPNGLICGKLSMGIGGISSCILTKVEPPSGD